MPTKTSTINEKVGYQSSLYQPLDKTALQKIADSAFEVLQKSGVAVYSDTAFKAFKKAGAVVDQESRTVKLPKALVEDSIDSNPSEITLYSRDQKTDIYLEKNRVHYGTGGTAIYVIDLETGKRRQSTNNDVALNARIVDKLQNIHLFTINVFPNDIQNNDSIDINRFFHAFDNTQKHIMGGIYSLKGCKQVIDMAEMIAGSEDALRKKPFVSFITLLISPFKIDNHYGEMTCHIAEKGLPVVVPTEPICGTTSPVTLAGNTLTHIAETLAGIAMVQCVKKGAPGICGSVGSITDLRTMNHLGGAIERAMINSAVAQLAQHFKLPLYSTAGTTDSKKLDMQSSYESAMSNLLVAMSGANYIHDSAGLMESDLTVSYEKLVVDDEILGMCQRVLKGIEVNDDTLGLEMMINKGPAKDYLAEEHTIKHMHNEFFMPKLANRQKRENTENNTDAISRAKLFAEEIKNAEPQSCLESNLRSKILTKFTNIKC